MSRSTLLQIYDELFDTCVTKCVCMKIFFNFDEAFLLNTDELSVKLSSLCAVSLTE